MNRILLMSGEELTVDELAARHPTWVEDTDQLPAGRVDARCEGLLPRALPEHPCFEPWREAILSTAVPRVELDFWGGGELDGQESFGGGALVFLDRPGWPTCSSCHAPLDLVFQLSADLHGPWTSRDESLVALYCFECRPRQNGDGRSFIGFVEPTTMLEREPGRATAERQFLKAARAVWQWPDWRTLMSRSSKLGGACASLEEASIRHGERLISIDSEYMGWVYPDGGYETSVIPPRVGKMPPLWNTWLGGYPWWHEDDGTPGCPSCQRQMIHVLDYNGNQFKDTAMHVFMCDRGACKDHSQLVFVVE